MSNRLPSDPKHEDMKPHASHLCLQYSMCPLLRQTSLHVMFLFSFHYVLEHFFVKVSSFFLTKFT